MSHSTMTAEDENTSTRKAPPRLREWRLEDVLATLQADLMRRTALIAGDETPQMRLVYENNVRVMELLDEAITRTRQSRSLANAMKVGL